MSASRLRALRQQRSDSRHLPLHDADGDERDERAAMCDDEPSMKRTVQRSQQRLVQRAMQESTQGSTKRAVERRQRARVNSAGLSRVAAWALALATLVVTAAGCRSDERSFFDFTHEPEGELIAVSADALRRRIVVEGMTQSEVAARIRFGDTCDGYVSERAPYTLRLDRELALQLNVESEADEDLVLVLTGRSGLRCNDDAKGLLPGMQTRLAAGDYSVFVGTLYPSPTPRPFRLVIAEEDPALAFQGLSSSELSAEFQRLAQWNTPVSASAFAALEARVNQQRTAFEDDVPSVPPDLQARALLGVHRVDRGEEGELLRLEYESQGVAPVWLLAGSCGGFVRARGADALLRISSAFEGRVECQASADVEIELAIRGPKNEWRCGGRQARGIAQLSLDAFRSGEHAVMVASVEPTKSFRVLLSCTAFEAPAPAPTPPHPKSE